MKDIQKIIENGVDFLIKKQESDGGFLSLSSDRLKFDENCKSYKTVFFPALILSISKYIKSKRTILLTGKLSKYLLGQKSELWTFNYWDKESIEYNSFRVPDDLDDTMVAWVALYQNDKKIFKPEVLALITKVLLANEKKEGGPYRTWLIHKTKDKRWLDTDVAVNANAAYFLKLMDIDLKSLNNYLSVEIKKNIFKSIYYPSSYPIIYYLSRLDFRDKKILIKWCLDHRNQKGYWSTPLETALMVLSMLNMGYDKKLLRKAVEYLLVCQQGGKWEASAYCCDPAIEGRKYYAGSETLTTAFCLAALSEYVNTEDIVKTENIIKDNKNEKIYDNIINKLTGRLKEVDDNLSVSVKGFADRIIKKDADGEIVLLPYYFYNSLMVKKTDISCKVLDDLCLANLYGWIAYTIYDDFFDDEGEKKYLSSANFCLRELTNIYSKISNDSSIGKIYLEAMDEMDVANDWEVKNCRVDMGNGVVDVKKWVGYGQTDRIAKKSLGHAISPLVLMKLTNPDISREELDKLKKLLISYLTARQLNDDAHDWESDLMRGQVNMVAEILLREYSAYSHKRKINIKQSIDKLRLFFWKKTIKKIAEIIVDEIEKVRFDLLKLKKVKNDFLGSKLEKLERSARKAVDESEQMIKFINNF